MSHNYPQHVIVVILLLSYLLTSCNWEKGDCGYDGDRCRQPGKDGHGRWVVKPSDNKSFPSHAAISNIEDYNYYSNYEVSSLSTRQYVDPNDITLISMASDTLFYVREGLNHELAQSLNLQELIQFKAKLERELHIAYALLYYTFGEEIEKEVTQKLQEALTKVEEKIDQRSEEQEIQLGKEQAQISKEAGRPIKHILKPGERIAIPFLAQFQYVDIQIEPTKDIELLGKIDLARFKQVSIHTNTECRMCSAGRKTLHSTGFMKVRASMQGESSFTIRAVENLKVKMLIQPGEKLSMDLLKSFKQVGIHGTHAISLFNNELSSQGFVQVSAKTEGEGFTINATNTDFKFTLQPGEKINLSILEEQFKWIDVQSEHAVSIVGNPRILSSDGFVDISGRDKAGEENKPYFRTKKSANIGNTKPGGDPKVPTWKIKPTIPLLSIRRPLSTNIKGSSIELGQRVSSNTNPESKEKDYDFSGGEKIPHSIQLDNGKTVHIDFGNSEDGVSADHAVNPKLVAALKTFLNIASKSCDFHTIYISATTNGHDESTVSNHKVENGALALDISRIDGQRIEKLGPLHPLVIGFQEALDELPNIRENFGPYWLHKGEGVYSPKPVRKKQELEEQHRNHIHFSINK